MEVVNNREKHHFEMGAAVLTYREKPGEIAYLHTEVPKELEGKGIAGKLAKTALEYAREQGLKVHPFCPFVKTYIERHPEYQDLVAPSK